MASSVRLFMVSLRSRRPCVGIVAELHLDLAVGLAVHKDVALGMDRIGNVGKAAPCLRMEYQDLVLAS